MLAITKKQFNPDKTQDLSCVLYILDKAINDLGLYRNNLMEGFWEDASGYFYFHPVNKQKEFFVGLWHDGTEEMRNFWIERFHWDKKEGEKISLKYGEFYKTKGSVAWFKLKDECFADLVSDKVDIEQKYEILKGFIREVKEID